MIFLITILTFSLFALLPIKVGLIFHKKANCEDMTIKMEFLKIIKLHIRMPKMFLIIKGLKPLISYEYFLGGNKINFKAKRETIPIMGKRLKTVVYIVKNLYKDAKRWKSVTKFLSKHVVVEHLWVKLKIGNSNHPFMTGIIAGQVWSIIYILIGFASSFLDLSQANIDVKVYPIFDHGELGEMSFDSIFRLRVGHIIIVGFSVLYYLLILRRNKNRGSDNLWTGIRLKV